jgi:hypothetical protein
MSGAFHTRAPKGAIEAGARAVLYHGLVTLLELQSLRTSARSAAECTLRSAGKQLA